VPTVHAHPALPSSAVQGLMSRWGVGVDRLGRGHAMAPPSPCVCCSSAGACVRLSANEAE
jgi:hypothetical protein